MAQFAAGAGHRLVYKKEAVWGTAEAGPGGFSKLRNVQCSLDLTKGSITSNEIRSDRQVVDLRHGAKKVAGDIQFELSAKNFDDMIEAALFSDFAQATTTPFGGYTGATNMSMAVTTGVLTGPTDWTTGLTVGDYVYITGFTNAINNGLFKVSAVDSTTLTLLKSTGGTWGSFASISETGVSAMVASVAIAGTTRTQFTFERGFTDLASPSYGTYSGCMINTMSLSIKPEQMVTGSFGFIGKTASFLSSSALTGIAEPDYTFSPFDTFSGAILEGGSSIASVSSLDISISNNLSPNMAVNSNSASGITAGRFNVTGTLACYFEAQAMLDKFLNETISSLKFTLGGVEGAVGTQTYVLPKIKYSGASVPVQGDGPIMMNMPFTAIFDATSTAAMYVCRRNV